MDKPHFIRGLLEQVGTAIDPIQLVRRIPEGLEIEGLRDGIGRMVREYEIQHSISDGVAKVLRGEVAQGMDTLRAGRRRGIKFEILPCDEEADNSLNQAPDASKGDAKPAVDIRVKGPQPTASAAATTKDSSTSMVAGMQSDQKIVDNPEGDAPPGHCTGCHRPFTLPTPGDYGDMENGVIPPSLDTLVGFACGHVFHLSCLLPKTSASASIATSLQSQVAASIDQGDGYWDRSVNSKITHALFVKTAIGKGCVVCREREAVTEA